jgi:trk system potassium uptake protein TrkA
MKVIIAGLGDTGRQLAEELSTRGGFNLVLIDRDPEICEALSQELDALVMNGDATEPQVLQEAGAQEADALIAATESDAMNMVIAILGKRLSIGKVIVKLNTLNLRSACNQIGIDHVILPKVSAAMEITSLLYGYNVLNLSYLIKGGARIMEIPAGKMAGKQVGELELPEGALLVAVLQQNVATVPRSRTRLQDTDTLLVVAESTDRLDQVRELFSPGREPQPETGAGEERGLSGSRRPRGRRR